MAISFADLHTEAGIKILDEFLSGKTYISGDQISKDDIRVYAAVTGKPGAGFPNASRWHETVSSALAARFPGEAAGVKIAGQAATPAPSSAVSAAETEKEAPAAAAAVVEDEDDELDLFGDETEEEKKAAADREASKPSSKKKESGKSSILLDVKPWDDETDMVNLEKAVRSVQIEGLLWGASKLVPVGYGIKKLQIMLTIVDDLVSVDSLIEEQLTAEPCSEFVQSCDIVAFNKI